MIDLNTTAMLCPGKGCRFGQGNLYQGDPRVVVLDRGASDFVAERCHDLQVMGPTVGFG